MQQLTDPPPEDRTTFAKLGPPVYLSVGVLAAAYFVALTGIGGGAKTFAFAILLSIYLGGFWLLRRREAASLRVRLTDAENNAAIERAIELLDEACTVFGGSLDLADSFRLASSRIAHIFPTASVRLYLQDDSRQFLRAVHATGQDAEIFDGKTIVPGHGAVGEAFATSDIIADGESAAIPLYNGPTVFGVLEVTGISKSINRQILEAISTKCSKLMHSALAKEHARDNSLIDATTSFPNERAFRLVLENQSAEAQRERGERGLTVLAIDIRRFDELNQTFGHAAGDRVLRFTASTIKDNLRAMDFIARSRDDEFLVVLPTADAGVSREIIERIHAGFAGHKIVINDSQAREVELNIGSAAFGVDGETPQQLIGMARLRKQEAKSGRSARVLNFPQEPSNLLN